MSPVGQALSVVLLLFILLLFFRLVMEWVFSLSRSFRPSGLLAAALEITYTVTDPPLRLLRRWIPPLGIGSVRIDLSFIVLFFVASILLNVVRTI